MTKKPLTIGVDVRVRKVAKTGIRTYIGELRREFENMNRDNLRFHFLDTSIPIYNGNNKLMKWVGHFRFQLWKQIILPLKAWSKRCDVLFCVDDCVPYIHLGYKTIATIHDAFCFESPEQYGKLWLWLYKNTAIPAARRSSFIVTKTAYGKGQIAHFTGLPAEKLIVVYDGGPKRVIYDGDIPYSTHILNDFELTPFNYILHAGAMFKRKNLVALVNAFNEIKKIGYPGLKLVLAGSLLTHESDNDYKLIIDIIKNESLQSDVVITGYLTDQQLDQLYKNALLYVFPSLNEGFGLPVLEGFEHNLPVLVADNTCLPEVGGDAVLQFNPFDIHDMAVKIRTVLDDAELRKQMIIKGRKRLMDFSWAATAAQIVELFKKAANYS